MTKNAGVLPMPEMPDLAAQYLGLLGMELHARGMWCELVTTGCVPRLKLSVPWRWAVGVFDDKAFEDHILATDAVDGRWSFWWPWIQPIAPVGDLAGAADHIIRNTLDALSEDATAETSVVFHAVVNGGTPIDRQEGAHAGERRSLSG